MQRPLIAITMGDPSGVGPELVLRALGNLELRTKCRLAIFGDSNILNLCADRTKLPRPTASQMTPAEFLSGSVSEEIDAVIVDHPTIDLNDFKIGCVQAACGQASFDYIQSSIDAVLAGQVDAVTTGPINKEAVHAAGISFPGHTEMFAERDGAERWCMMQYSPEITCTFVTVHVGYAEVPGLITEKRVRDTIDLTAEALRRIHNREPNLAVCGLNPHAGEHGLFGDGEEERAIIPAIESAQRDGIQITGPLPPDTAFLPSKREIFDAVVCMYHDQGHIPLKAIAFDSAVNTTLGLRVIRTSVDHGTAFDIAWKGVAKPDSLLCAVRLAAQLSQREKIATNT